MSTPVENRLLQLQRFGQSPWFDYISRPLIAGGGLKRMVDRDGLGGVTSNPSIFEKAIGSGKEYDREILELAHQGFSAAQIFDRLAIDDVRAACDVLAPVYLGTGGDDGFVSIEVSPKLAFDADATIAEAHRIFTAVDRPNVMIKIPGTKEGVPAVRACLEAGLNINITLLFSMSQYEAVAEAYMDALEERLRRNLTLRGTSSVASFFVSRVDTLGDRLLDERIAATEDVGERRRLEGLKGRAAVANSKLVYERFQAYLSVEALAAAGAGRRQGPARPLGEHEHQERGVQGHDVRRRAHRRAHREHAAREHLARVPRARDRGAHGRQAPRRRAPRAARARRGGDRHGAPRRRPPGAGRRALHQVLRRGDRASSRRSAARCSPPRRADDGRRLGGGRRGPPRRASARSASRRGSGRPTRRSGRPTTRITSASSPAPSAG